MRVAEPFLAELASLRDVSHAAETNWLNDHDYLLFIVGEERGHAQAVSLAETTLPFGLIVASDP